MNRLQEKYKNVVVPQMMKDFEYKSVMEVPHVEKVVINIGVGDAITNAKLLDEAVEELRTSNCVKVCQLDVKLLYVKKKCMNS